MASLSFLRWRRLLTPSPSSKSSSVNPSSTWRAEVQTSIKPECTPLTAHSSRGTTCTRCVPCHSWYFQSRLGCTWASPWQPPSRPGLHLPSTATCMWCVWAPPAGGGRAAPRRPTGSAVWGCQSLDWFGRGYGVAYRRGSGSEGNHNTRLIWTQFDIKVPNGVRVEKFSFTSRHDIGLDVSLK